MSATKQDSLWIEHLVMALRLEEVPGAQIGDIVAEVEGHCAESGLSPQDAFGDATHYAAQRAAELPSTDAPSDHGLLRMLLPSVLAVVSLFLLLPAVGGLRHGEPAEIGIQVLILPVLLAIGTVALRRWLGALVTHPVRGVLALSLAFVVMMVPAFLHVALVRVPAAALAVLGVVTLVASVVLQRQWPVAPDRVVDPMTGQDRYDDGSLGSRVVDLIQRTRGLGIVATAALGSALIWFLG